MRLTKSGLRVNKPTLQNTQDGMDFSNDPSFLCMREINKYYLKHPSSDSMTLPHEIGRMLLPRIEGAITVPTIYGFVMRFSLDSWDGELNGSVEKNLFFLGSYEPGTLEIMSRSAVQNGTFIDVGGHVGTMTVFMAIVGKAKKIMVFEPNPDSHKHLKHNIQLNNLEKVATTFTCGLGEKSAKADLFKNPNSSGMTQLTHSSTGSISVEPLDEVLACHEPNTIPQIRLIKIDVEGGELAVINGARKTIQSHRPDIVIEYAPNNVNLDLVDVLKSFGYDLFVLSNGRHRLGKLIPFMPQNTSQERSDNLFCYHADSPAHPNHYSRNN